ncbi:hypothetical protein PIB30_094439 [Stylosanthes scabra]|uniref:Uncharacterized protein n=1 Tax=Stylosanthes scabra TaxID=79078 RepID=A0ABU6YW05_9FABA|nr:hypothetical protein [Stylosanthes scabra]
MKVQGEEVEERAATVAVQVGPIQSNNNDESKWSELIADLQARGMETANGDDKRRCFAMPSPLLKIARFSVLLGSDHMPRCLLEAVRCSSQKSCRMIRSPQVPSSLCNNRLREEYRQLPLRLILPDLLPGLLPLPQPRHSGVPPPDHLQDLPPDLYPFPLPHEWCPLA